MTSAANMLSAALAYTACGWAVLPLHSMAPRGCSCFLSDACETPAKHPRISGGVKNASAGPGRVGAWWRRWADANVGIATGAVSGVVVLDIDPRNGGDDSLVDLEHEHGRLPETLICHTGGGGTHFYFAAPAGRKVGNHSALGAYPGIDLKGDAGYVVAPPSRHASGGRYEWDSVLDLDAAPLAPCPPALLTLADARRQVAPAAYTATDWDGRLPEAAARVLACSPGIHARYMRSAGGLGDPSPSGVDFALARALASCGIGPAEIEGAIRASRSRAGLPWRRETYFRSTVGKALALARKGTS